VLPKASTVPQSGGWNLATKLALAVVALFLGVILFAAFVIATRTHFAGRNMRSPRDVQVTLPSGYAISPDAPVPVPSGYMNPPAPPEPIEAPASPDLAFGPVQEMDLQARQTGTNEFFDLDSGQLLTPPTDIVSIMTGDPLHPTRHWMALDILPDSRDFKYPKWLQENGVDLMYAENGKILGFDALFAPAHGTTSTNWDDWDSLSPENVRAAADVFDWHRRAANAAQHGEPVPPGPQALGGYNPIPEIGSNQTGGPRVTPLTRDQSVTWFFQTREGAAGLLQIVSFTNDPPAAKIRYKLLQQPNGAGVTVPITANNTTDETLADRLQAAIMMRDFTAKDRALNSLALDAAKAGNAKVALEALQGMRDFSTRSHAGLETVRALAKRGLRKPAIEIAKTITDFTIRDQALAELAQQ